MEIKGADSQTSSETQAKILEREKEDLDNLNV